MYSNGSSHFSKQKMQAQRKMHYHSKGKSCGYYMRIIFFFSSLIQSLIIVSLVLFLVYGKPQDSASTDRIEDLEKSFSRLSIENVALRQQRKNLTNLLNVTLIEKARNDWDLARLRYVSNISATLIQDLDRKLHQCQGDLLMCRSSSLVRGQCQPMQPGHCHCDIFVEQLRARLDLVASNFTQTTQVLRRELDQTAKERDNLHLALIGLRRDKFMHEKEVELYKQRCKEDFVESLSGVSNVTKAFLQKVESLFPTHIAFQLTCPKQREHLEQIRTNCTSLSREVEDKFQRYLNSVGNQVSGIQGENSRLKAENWRLTDDYRTCSQNRTGLIQQHKQNIDKLQQKHDTEKEALLIDKMKLNGEIEVLNNNVRYKNMEVEHIKEQLRQLNMSCMAKMGLGAFPGGSRASPGPWNSYSGGGGSSSSSSSSSGGGQLGRTGSGSSYGSYGSTANKPVSPVLNSPSSSVMSTGYGSSGGVGVNRQGSAGSGSSSSATGYGSSSGYGVNKQSSTGSGSSSSSTGYGSSSGYGVNKQSSAGSGSSSSSTGYGSSSGYGVNKQSSAGSGSSSSSTGYGSSSGVGVNRQGSAGSGSSSSSTGHGSSSGVGVNKQGSTGSGSSASSTGYGSSSGYGVNKQGSIGSGSSASSAGSVVSGRGPSAAGSSLGSAGASQNVGSSGTGVNKPTASAKSSTSPGSTGSASKSGSSGSSWWLGFGGGNSGQSKTGSATAKGPSSGSSYSGSSSAGRTNGQGGGSVSVAQHLQDLQRLINPSGPEDRQDLSRMMG